MLFPFRESLLSQLYAGFYHSTHALKPAVETMEARLSLPPHRRHKVIWRIDAGFGSDANVAYLHRRGYHFLVKGHSNRRAAKLAQQVKYWRRVDQNRFVGRAPTPATLADDLHTFVVRTHGPKRTRLTYLITTRNLTGLATVRLYDQRGGAETEFRADKSGGAWLHKRRKHKRDAQEAWIHLTDMAHNYLAWFAYTKLPHTPFAGFGPLRITRDLFRVPGHIEWHQGQLFSVKLLKSVPHADQLLVVLRRFFE
ncbi:MAG: transposase [Reinekea sp.]|nr:transposase [Reinekea sp.]